MNDTEKRLIEKEYYTLFSKQTDNTIVLKELSKKLYEENNGLDRYNEKFKYSQGELYFLLGDFESAIFKWNQVSEDSLYLWARKNMADAYIQFFKWNEAEEILSTMNPLSKELNMERLLSMYHLYEMTNQIDKQSYVVLKLVDMDWEYNNVYEMAQSFYQRIQDWENWYYTVLLKLNKYFHREIVEIILTQLDTISGEKISINDALYSLTILHHNNCDLLPDLFEALNKVFMKSTVFLQWVNGLYLFFQSERVLAQLIMVGIPQTFSALLDELHTNGNEIVDVQKIIVNLIPSWMELAEGTDVLPVLSSYVLAWDEKFPKTFSSEDVGKAEKHLKERTLQPLMLELMAALHEKIKSWMEMVNNPIDVVNEWWIQYFLSSKRHIMISGSFGNGKSSFINSVISENVLTTDILPTTSAIILLDEGKSKQFSILSNEGMRLIEEQEFYDYTVLHHLQSDETHQKDPILLQVNEAFFREFQVILIDTPGFNDGKDENNPTLHNLYLADELLFIFDSANPLKKTEKQVLMKMRELSPNLIFHYVLNKFDIIDEDEQEDVFEDISRKLKREFGTEPDVIPYSSTKQDELQKKAIQDFFAQPMQERALYNRVKKVTSYLASALIMFESTLMNKEQKLHNYIQLRKKHLEKLEEEYINVKRKQDETISLLHQHFIELKTDIYNYMNNQNIPLVLRTASQRLQLNRNETTYMSIMDREINKILEALFVYKIMPYISNQLMVWLENHTKVFGNSHQRLNDTKLRVQDIIGTVQEVKLESKLYKLPSVWKIELQQFINGFTYIQNNTFKQTNLIKSMLNGMERVIGGNSSFLKRKIEEYQKTAEERLFEEVNERFIYTIMYHFNTFEQFIPKSIHSHCETYHEQFEMIISDVRGDMVQNIEEAKYIDAKRISYMATLSLFDVKIKQMNILTMDIKQYEKERMNAHIKKTISELTYVLKEIIKQRS